MVLIHAQNPRVKLPTSISRVEYRFTNVGPIEITAEQVLAAPGTRGVATIPVLSPWGFGVLILLLLSLGTLFLQRRRSARQV